MGDGAFCLESLPGGVELGGGRNFKRIKDQS